MSIDPVKAEKFREVFQQIADILNQCSPEERAAIRTGLGEYTHDLKHFLGVVLGAQTLMAFDGDTLDKHGDMLEIIVQSVKDLDGLFEILIHNLPNEILIED